MVPLPPEAFSTPLLAWFQARQRDLPWRRTRDPYEIWISEIMLQQTQVATVREYWERFTRRFPTAQALAEAPLDQVLKLWEGLGYYSRARNLHAAAKLIVSDHGGALPADPAKLRRLPGFGPYTAGAVSAIAFGLPEPAVDGNVLRVLARLLAWEDDVSAPPTRRKAEGLARSLIPEGRAGDFAQALMELGALVCTPRKPRCETCPVAGACRARLRGIAQTLPRKARRARAPHADVLVAVCVRGSDALVVRRPEKGLLGGLMAFPAVRLDPDESPRHAVSRALREVGLRARIAREPLAEYRFAFTHLRTTHCAYLADWRGGEPGGDARWEDIARLGDLAFPAALAPVRAALQARVLP